VRGGQGASDGGCAGGGAVRGVACGRRCGEGRARVWAAAWRGTAKGDSNRATEGRGFRGPGRFIFVGLTEADKNIGYFRGPGPWPTKIFHMFVDQEADENNYRIFVGRLTKIFRPTKIYVFPIVGLHIVAPLPDGPAHMAGRSAVLQRA
jgi:hypothetical protein